MAQTSFALMTTVGRNKEAAAIANATAITITHIAIGDGATVPSGGETALYHEVVRKTVVDHGVVVGASNVAYFDAFLSAAEGPYTIREAGLIDEDGDLIAIAHYDPAINKPTPDSGQTVEGTVRIEVAFTSLANVNIVIDDTMKVALQRLTVTPWIPIKSITTTTPPASPAVGDTYAIPAGATGAWAGHAQKIAEYTPGGWSIINTPNGHGAGLVDGRVYEKVAGTYVEKLALDTQSGKWTYVAAGGTANALTAALTPAPSANTAGMVVRVKTAATNTGAATLNVNGLGALPIVTLKGVAIEAGDLPADSVMTYVCTGTQWMLAGAAYSEFRQRLKADLDLYCRPDGNDNNDGLTNTAGGAFRHPQAALNAIQTKYDVAGRAVNIYLADGSYNGFAQQGYSGASVNLIGNVTTPANVTVNGAGHASGNPVGLYYGAQLNVRGIAFTGPGRVYVQSGAAIGFNGNCRLNNGTGGVPKITCDINSLVYVGPSVTLNAASGNAAALIAVSSSSSLITYNTTFIDAGSLTYSDAVVVVIGSSATIVGTWAGSPTGKRYRVSAGLIFTNGAGASYIPGTVAGTSDESWMYQ